jgi:DinB family protein
VTRFPAHAKSTKVRRGILLQEQETMSQSARHTVAIRLHTQLDCLSTILSRVPKDALDRRPTPDKWSGRENLAHLARYHQVFRDRIHRTSTEDRPLLPRYRAEEDSEWQQWVGKPADVVLEDLRALREDMIGLFEGLSGAELMRTALHSRFGEMTLLQWLEFFLLHEAHHLYVVMQRIRESP